MSRLSEVMKSASRRSRDVRVVVNGELQAERERLVREVVRAAEVKNARLAKSNVSAQKALDEWDAAHVDEVVTLRLVALSQAEWRMLIRKHPVPKDHDQFDGRYGCATVDVAVEFLRKHGRVLDGDEVERPEPAEWDEFLNAVTPGDMYRIAMEVQTVHNETSEMGFGDLVKA